jgi:hypothetical protein
MDRYETNNGIVLRYDPHRDHRNGEVLFFLDGLDLGLATTDGPEIALPRAEPIFRALLETHNKALTWGQEMGRAHAQQEMQAALGLR